MGNLLFKMIRFIRLLFYHIFLYYEKNEKSGKIITKLSTILVFTVVFSLFTLGLFDFIYQKIDINYTGLKGVKYIYWWIFIFIILSFYLYYDNFNDIDGFKDYHVKYYFYFFIITVFSFFFAIYTAQISRKRIYKQRAIQNKTTLSPPLIKFLKTNENNI